VNADDEVILASLNLHGGRRADGSPFDTEAACTGLKADVIALQEVWRPDEGPDLVSAAAAALDAAAIHVPLLTGTTLASLSIAPDQEPGTWGMAVITALPVRRYAVASLGRAPGDPVPRSAQLVTAELPGGRRLRIANTHLTHRFTSPLQLLRLTRLLRLDPVPTVIVGDLNMPGPVSGLAAGYSPAVGGRTFPAHRPLVQLDHMLAGRGVTARDGEVGAFAGSDHRPIRARLGLG
jgi:endonuclease/exonuclease/phosphatase family metal-dependent hydrolase